MKHRLTTLLVGFGSVAVDIGQDKKMSQHIQYASHAQVLKAHPQFDWQAVVDPNPIACAKAVSDWGIPIVSPSMSDLPADFDPDVVIIATRPDVRLSILEALPNIKGAIIEKPLGTSYAEGAQLENYCRRRGLKVNVNLFRRADPTNRNLVAGEMDAAVGDVQAATILYGKGLRNNGIHMIDLLRMLCGEIIQVRSLSPMKYLSGGPLKADGEASIALTLAQGGIVMMSPINFKHYRDVYIDFWGTKGRLEIFQSGLFLRFSELNEHRAIEGEMEMSIDLATVQKSECGVSYYEMYSNLAASIFDNADLFCPIEEAIASEAVVEAAFLSAEEEGRVVDVAEIGARYS